MPGLEDLYREIILDHYRAPRNRGELPVPPAHKAEGFNPLCGDEVVLYLDVDDGTVTDLKIAAGVARAMMMRVASRAGDIWTASGVRPDSAAPIRSPIVGWRTVSR